jgi:nicotinamide phosphoribosyltransferase
VYSYFESRGGKFPEVTFFGLQYIIKRYLTGQVITKEKIDAAEKVINAHMGLGEMKHFNREGWEYILNEHGGKLPVIIKACPEGLTVPVKNVLMTVVNTDPKCYWLTNYLETLLVQVWYPMTVATQSREQKKVIVDYLEKTGCPTDGLVDVAYRLNDFGCRGVSSMETAAIGGAAHLINFGGSDTMPGLCCLVEYYGLPLEFCMGTSIPAAEHSTITSWTKEGELDAFRNMLTSYPEGLVAVVSDSYDIYNACKTLWGKELVELIKNRKGCLVVRPDSGDPPVIVCEVLELLAEAFGTEKTETGHKLLPPYIRVIQGDGVSYESLGTILAAMEAKGWAAGNLAFGSGGALLQKLNRDTQKCAFKCCEAIVNGEARYVYKDPVTDKGKASKKGQLKLVKDGASYKTLTEGQGDAKDDLLVTVFENGVLMKDWSKLEVSANAAVINKKGIVAGSVLPG